jgi:molecular chaperone DnaK
MENASNVATPPESVPPSIRLKFKAESLEALARRYQVDFSGGGVFVRTREPYPTGTILPFRFELLDGSVFLEGRGKVVWFRTWDPTKPEMVPGFGLRFDDMPFASWANFKSILARKLQFEHERAAVHAVVEAAAAAPPSEPFVDC